LGATATRNLPTRLAGAGSGVYNTTRQVGSVLGSASMAAFMSSRVTAELPAAPVGAAPRGGADVTALPQFLHAPFAAAMSQSMLLPAFVALFGVLAAIFMVGAVPGRTSAPRREEIYDELFGGPDVGAVTYGRHAATQSNSTAGLR
jgi:hypothetical protein